MRISAPDFNTANRLRMPTLQFRLFSHYHCTLLYELPLLTSPELADFVFSPLLGGQLGIEDRILSKS